MNTIRFSLPEEYGVQMYINSDEYSLYPVKDRLTDSFMDQLIHTASTKNDQEFELYDSPEKDSKVILKFHNQNLEIHTKNKKIIHENIPYDAFVDAFLNHVRKYAIYFAAPYNYKSIMLKPFDEMITSMKKYQPEADNILARSTPTK